VDFREETTTAWECEPGKDFPCGIHIQLDLLDVGQVISYIFVVRRIAHILLLFLWHVESSRLPMLSFEQSNRVTNMMWC
jgi:hypothetical protein